jgi:hypothetical protein
MSDLGLTHVALSVRNLNESIAFYTKYAAMKVVHQRADTDTGIAVAWMTDGTRPFVIVLAEWREQRDPPLAPSAIWAWDAKAAKKSTGYAPRHAPKGGCAAAPQTRATRSAIGPLSPTPTATTSRSLSARMSASLWSAHCRSRRLNSGTEAGRLQRR